MTREMQSLKIREENTFVREASERMADVPGKTFKRRLRRLRRRCRPCFFRRFASYPRQNLRHEQLLLSESSKAKQDGGHRLCKEGKQRTGGTNYH